jgi:hypothetical protein
MPTKEKRRMIDLGDELADQLSAECPGGVSAYVRSLVQADSWRLGRARQVLETASTAPEDYRELADLYTAAHASDRLGVAEACAIVAEAARMGRRTP